MSTQRFVSSARLGRHMIYAPMISFARSGIVYVIHDSERSCRPSRRLWEWSQWAATSSSKLCRRVELALWRKGWNVVDFIARGGERFLPCKRMTMGDGSYSFIINLHHTPLLNPSLLPLQQTIPHQTSILTPSSQPKSHAPSSPLPRTPPSLPHFTPPPMNMRT